MVRQWASIHGDELDANWERTQVLEPPAPIAPLRCASRTTIAEVEPLAERRLRLTFADGAVHEVDLAGVLQAGGVSAQIRDDRDVFESVAVDRAFGTIAWPGAPGIRRSDSAQSHPAGQIERRRILRVPRSTVRELASNRRIPFLKVGRRTLFDQELLRQWIAQQTVRLRHSSRTPSATSSASSWRGVKRG